eukprot:CAMPEP_0172727850 /NCGR_PEP_ID=MMETSP1074-20121228/91905_1 /TAXON_ID=2916 /ORGANISM="Ceratium fusus, Strain PA161109" /LENGTH=378 /DNA_ID=CAMNT_0013555031 /DNA_START=56 /DNA_END=1192 /DNA_ORIENTATION=-
MALASFQLAQQVPVGQDVYIFRLCCNCDNTLLAVATSENTVCILDPATLQPACGLQGHTDMVEDLAFYQGSAPLLASCSHDGSARLWDVRASPCAVRTFEVANSREVYSCSVGRGDTALACTASEKVYLFDLAQGKRLCTYKECHTDVVNHVRFHPVRSTILFTGAEDNLIVALDTNEANEDQALLGIIPTDECVRSFTFVGPDRNTVCSASTLEDVRIWDLSEESFGSRRAEFVGLRDNPLLVTEESGGYVIEAFYDQPSGQVFVLAGAGDAGKVLLFRTTPAGMEPAAVFTSHGESSAQLQGHTGIIRSAICMPGGTILTAGEDSMLCAWREGPSLGTTDVAGAGSAAVAEFRFELEPTSYGAQRGSDVAARPTPY